VGGEDKKERSVVRRYIRILKHFGPTGPYVFVFKNGAGGGEVEVELACPLS